MTIEGQVKTKKEFILKLIRSKNPDQSLRELAETHNLSYGYMRNIRSRYMTSKRGRLGRSSLYDVHGLCFFYESIPVSWVEGLDVLVVNGRSGMRQIGFKGKGDPCSVQFEKNGAVRIYVHRRIWRPWLLERLLGAGWNSDQAESLAFSKNLKPKRVEVPVRIPGIDSLAERLGFDDLVTDAGISIHLRDGSHPDAAEVVVDFNGLAGHLGIADLKRDMAAVKAGVNLLLAASGIGRGISRAQSNMK